MESPRQQGKGRLYRPQAHQERYRSCSQCGAEYIIACIHWGNEYQMLPSAEQKSLAQFMRDNGVDAIIGGHPHVIQPIEITDGDSKLLTVYSLGNFISNMKTKDTRGGALVKIRLTRGDDNKVRLTDASYRLVFTEPATSTHNFRLKWVDNSTDYRAKAFSDSARAIFNKHNKNITEDIPDTCQESCKPRINLK